MFAALRESTACHETTAIGSCCIVGSSSSIALLLPFYLSECLSEHVSLGLCFLVDFVSSLAPRCCQVMPVLHLVGLCRASFVNPLSWNERSQAGAAHSAEAGDVGGGGGPFPP